MASDSEASNSSSSSGDDSDRPMTTVAEIASIPGKRARPADISDDTSSEASSSSSSESESESESPGVPALSHAERRRQKKKEKQQAREADNVQSDSGAPAAKKRKVEVTTTGGSSGNRQHSVWVGNMSFKTTPENLKEFFDGVGEVTRIHMPVKAPAGPGVRPENRGFAYVDFATADAKLAAIACSERPLIGRRLLIKDGDDYTGRPTPAPLPTIPTDPSDPTQKSAHTTHSKTAQKILRAQKQPPGPTLFLGNLGFETTEKSIRELFSAHRNFNKSKPKAGGDEGASDSDGEGDDERDRTKPKVQDVWIRKVRLGTFEDSGLCKGFAFIDFTSTSHATTALINPKNHTLDGRALVVEYASADAVRRGAVKPKRAPGSERGEGGRPSTFRGLGKGNANGAKRPPRQSRFADDLAASGEYTPDAPYQGSANMDVDAVGGGGDAVGGGEEAGMATGRRERVKGPRVRPKPGAALALAKRESAAILPSVGSKITF